MKEEFDKNLFQGDEKSLDLFLVFDYNQVIFSSENWPDQLLDGDSWDTCLSGFNGLVNEVISFFNDEDMHKILIFKSPLKVSLCMEKGRFV